MILVVLHDFLRQLPGRKEDHTVYRPFLDGDVCVVLVKYGHPKGTHDDQSGVIQHGHDAKFSKNVNDRNKTLLGQQDS